MGDILERVRSGPASLPPGRYAMWFPSADEPLFAPSETRRNIDRVYEAAEGIATFVFAEILRWLGVPGDHAARVALPDALSVLPVLGPDDQVFALSACKEKGIRFHFHESSSAAYRNSVLAAFATHLEFLRRGIADSGAPLDEPGESSPAGWWRGLERAVAEIERRLEPLQAVGILDLG